MAENPIKTPLTADLPEDWTAGQIVAPDGEAAGLTKQHGYNYLMEKVNETRQAVNAIGESFEAIGGKRTCRFTVGTSAAGWTAADCDYLCDGTDDQEEINQAVAALPGSGGEIVLLSGSYRLSGAILLTKWNTVLRGNGGSTVLIRETAEGSGAVKCIIAMGNYCVLRDFAYNGGGHATENLYEIAMTGGGTVQNISFTNCGYGCIYVEGTGGTGHRGEIIGCTYDQSDMFIYVKSGSLLTAANNLCVLLGGVFIETAAGSNVSLLAFSNMGFTKGLNFVLDGLSVLGKSVIWGNLIEKLQVLQTQSAVKGPEGLLICSNIISARSSPTTNPNAIVLGENTRGIFVTGNMLLDAVYNRNYAVEDLGTNNIVRFNSDDLGGSTPATVEQAAPVLAVSAGGQVTATAIQQAGYVAAGTKNAALTLSAAQDADFIPENIKKGVSIFGVEGQLETGGGAAGVTSFNGRSGAVMPGDNDYTAQMVGAISSEAVSDIQLLSQEEYDALPEKDAAVLYLIKE